MNSKSLRGVTTHRGGNVGKLPFIGFIVGTAAILAGAIVNLALDKILGVRLELYHGVSTFSPIWAFDLFVIPFIAGLVVSLIYGLGGKLLCYFSPIIVRGWSYYEAVTNPEVLANAGEGVTVLPIAFWILILIVAIEAAAFGGAFGEVMVKKTYGRRPRYMVYKNKNSP